jgi:tight adherence protein C
MTRTVLLTGLGLGAMLLCTSGIWLMSYLANADKLSARLRRAQGLLPVRSGATFRRGGENAPLNVVARIGSTIARSGLLPRGSVTQLEHTLAMAGFEASNALGLFVGVKMLLVTSLPLAMALLLPSLGLSRQLYIALTVGAAIVGLLIPDYIIRMIRGRHLVRVEAGLPDALDMMVICAEAGLGLEPALVRVGAEIRNAHPALAEELARTSHELQMSTDSRLALTNMGGRTGLECLRRLGGTLIQTMQYGTPLSSALRVLSGDLRLETLTKFEERAARLPVLLTVPMILFILPCVFLVVGGPAVIQMMKALR